ncbi:MAG: YlbF family regulator [Oscillospiraceae bacterium]|jgi:cell fate (sporulation/competence/biofilm development) regulator YlbF (YheA/YmcA/DUF963 family)|nr:YlbF family regulator [Oscillospiraceae bacterium]
MDAILEGKARELARAIGESAEIAEMRRLKDAAYEDETNARLLVEYQRLQLRLQRGMLTGDPPDNEDMQRFQRIASLLMMSPHAQAFLLSQMRVQQTIGAIIQIVSDAADFPLSNWLEH